MGLSSSKSKTTTAQDTKESASTTPTNPPWVTDQVQAQGQRISDFMARDPQSLVAGPSALQQQAFAGAQGLGGWQAGAAKAAEMAAGAGNGPASSASAQGYAAPALGKATLAGGVTIAPTAKAQATLGEAQSLLDGFSNYMDPATQKLVDASMASYDEQAGRQRAALMADGARNSAFGGSRFGVAQGQFEADSGRNRSLTDAQLRANAFTQALNAANMDAGRRQEAGLFNAGNLTNISGLNAGADNMRAATQAGMDLQRSLADQNFLNQFQLGQFGADADAARFGADAANRVSMFNAGQEEAAQARALQAAGLIGDLANNQAANSRADLGMTADLGAIQQAIAQAQAAAPATQLLTAGQAMGAMPYNLFHGQDVTGTTNMTGTSMTKSKPSLFSSILDAGKMVGNAVAAGSDARLKRDIARIGSHGRLNLYSYNYHWDAPDRAKRIGVMADEVALHEPEALGPEIAGYKTVNYEKLGLAHLAEEV